MLPVKLNTSTGEQHLPTAVSIYLSTYLPTYLSTYLPIYLSGSLYVCEA